MTDHALLKLIGEVDAAIRERCHIRDEPIGRSEPILHELQMQNESTGERRAFIVEPHHPGQTSLRVRLEDGRYAITGIRHVRIIKERIVDAD